MRTEIGSEFWSVPITKQKNNVFPNVAKWFISGTSALEYILLDIMSENRVSSASIPSWCCSCMITPFLKNRLNVYFYDVFISDANRLTIDYSTTPKCDITLVISYFGYSDFDVIGEAGGIKIRDITHSLFSDKKYDDAEYYFGSLRKWLGVWTGGYAWKRNQWNYNHACPPPDTSYIQLRKTAMEQKKEYLDGTRDDKNYLKLFESSEDYLDQCGIEGCAERDITIAPYVDINHIRARRISNAKILLDNLRPDKLFTAFDESDCPMFVPLILEERQRNQLSRYLISKEIYCPIHWRETEFHQLNSRTKELYDREISIVCDQRYCENDMRRIISEINSFFG